MEPGLFRPARLWADAARHSAACSTSPAAGRRRRGVSLRQWLAGARNYLAEELRREKPEFSDALFPYLMAFGLDRDVDRWFQAFGIATAGIGQHGYPAGGGYPAAAFPAPPAGAFPAVAGFSAAAAPAPAGRRRPPRWLRGGSAVEQQLVVAAARPAAARRAAAAARLVAPRLVNPVGVFVAWRLLLCLRRWSDIRQLHWLRTHSDRLLEFLRPPPLTSHPEDHRGHRWRIGGGAWPPGLLKFSFAGGTLARRGLSPAIGTRKSRSTAS